MLKIKQRFTEMAKEYAQDTARGRIDKMLTLIVFVAVISLALVLVGFGAVGLYLAFGWWVLTPFVLIAILHFLFMYGGKNA